MGLLDRLKGTNEIVKESVTYTNTSIKKTTLIKNLTSKKQVKSIEELEYERKSREKLGQVFPKITQGCENCDESTVFNDFGVIDGVGICECTQCGYIHNYSYSKKQNILFPYKEKNTLESLNLAFSINLV